MKNMILQEECRNICYDGRTTCILKRHPCTEWSDVDRTSQGHLIQGVRVCTDPTAQVNDFRDFQLGKSLCLVLGDLIRRALFDADRVSYFGDGVWRKLFLCLVLGINIGNSRMNNILGMTAAKSGQCVRKQRGLMSEGFQQRSAFRFEQV